MKNVQKLCIQEYKGYLDQIKFDLHRLGVKRTFPAQSGSLLQ